MSYDDDGMSGMQRDENELQIMQANELPKHALGRYSE